MRDTEALAPELAATCDDPLLAAEREELRSKLLVGLALLSATQRAVVRVVVAWRRPLLVFSGLAAAAALVLLLRPAATTRAGISAASGSIAEALGVPAAYSESVEGRAPGADRTGVVKQ